MVQGSFQSSDFWPFKPLFKILRGPFGSVWAHSLTFSRILKSVNVNPELRSPLPPFHALALVANPRLGSWHLCFHDINYWTHFYQCCTFRWRMNQLTISYGKWYNSLTQNKTCILVNPFTKSIHYQYKMVVLSKYKSNESLAHYKGWLVIHNFIP